MIICFIVSGNDSSALRIATSLKYRLYCSSVMPRSSACCPNFDLLGIRGGMYLLYIVETDIYFRSDLARPGSNIAFTNTTVLVVIKE